MKSVHLLSIPPWRRPSRLLWFFLAVMGSCWLILHMPETSISRNQRQQIPSPSETSVSASSADATTLKPYPSLKRHPKRTPLEKILAKLKTFGRLFAIVGVAAFFGGIMEARCWHMALARIMGKLAQLARLPEVVGLAMPTALCSNAAANSMLVSSHVEGHIRTSALIAGGMVNSYLAYVSHSIRVMYPVIGAIGLPGVLYFTVQFLGGLVVICGVLLWNRWYIGRDHPQFLSVSPLKAKKQFPLSWPKATEKAATRALALLFRMVCITLPLMLGIEWLLKNGAFNFWEQAVPVQINHFFPVELVSVVAAQMGGLVQSSTVAAHLRAEGLINNAQILLAMLVGSAVGNPFRTLRRNLPSALGIFSPIVACIIVLGMQCSRFLTTLLAITALIALMHYMLY